MNDVHSQSRLSPDSTWRGLLEKVMATNCRRRLAPMIRKKTGMKTKMATRAMTQNSDWWFCGVSDVDDWLALSIANNARGVGNRDTLCWRCMTTVKLKYCEKSCWMSILQCGVTMPCNIVPIPDTPILSSTVGDPGVMGAQHLRWLSDILLPNIWSGLMTLGNAMRGQKRFTRQKIHPGLHSMIMFCGTLDVDRDKAIFGTACGG